jgi:YD repeat-containing protein
VTDADDNTTQYVYDGLGDETSESIVVGGQTVTSSYTYDADGDLLRSTDFDGRVIVYAYDKLGDETSESWYPNAADAAAQTNAQNAITYTYDADGQLKNTTYSNQPANLANEGYTYDGTGNRTSDATGNATPAAYTVGAR